MNREAGFYWVLWPDFSGGIDAPLRWVPATLEVVPGPVFKLQERQAVFWYGRHCMAEEQLPEERIGPRVLDADEHKKIHDAERLWETMMMKLVGEDGPKSVRDVIQRLIKDHDELLALAREVKRVYIDEHGGSMRGRSEVTDRVIELVTRVKAYRAFRPF